MTRLELVKVAIAKEYPAFRIEFMEKSVDKAIAELKARKTIEDRSSRLYNELFLAKLNEAFERGEL